MLAVQTGVDVRVSLFSPTGEELDAIDGFEWVPESIDFVAPSSGSFRITVQKAQPDGPSGSYELVPEAVRRADPLDEMRVQAQRLSTEAKKLEGKGGLDGLRLAYDRSRESLRMWREVEDRSAELGTLLRMGEIRYARGEYSDASDQFEQALRLSRELSDRRSEGECYNDLGMVKSLTDRPSDALSDFGRAVEIWQAEGFRYGLAAVLSNRSTLLGQTGEFTQALSDGTRALDFIRPLGDKRGEAFVHHSIGIAYGWLGDLEKALSHLERSVELFDAVHEQASAAKSLLTCGRIQLLMGHPAKALQLHLRALPTIQASGDQQWESDALNALGRVYYALGNRPRGMNYYQQALEKSRTAGYTRGQANALQDAGDYLAASGQPDRAVGAYLEALTLRREAGLRDAEAGTMYSLARLESSRRHFAEAREWLEKALAITESLRINVPGDQFRTVYLATRQGQYSLYIDTLMQLHRENPSGGFDRLAFEASERARARGLLDLLGETPNEIREGVSTALLQRERTLRRNLSFESWRFSGAQLQQAEQAVIRRRLDVLAREYEEMEAQIRTESPHYAALKLPQPLKLEEIQREVVTTPDTMLLEIAVGEERSYLWAVTATTLWSFQLPSKAVLEAAGRRIHQYITTPPAPRAVPEEYELFQKAANWLSARLLGPVAGELGRKTLLIVSDGALQNTPIGVLPLPRRGGAYTPVIAEHDVVYLPSASAMAIARREFAGRAPAPQTLAVLADPVFDPEDARVQRGSAGANRSQGHALQFRRLVFSRQEAEGILSFAPERSRMKALDFAASKVTATSSRLRQYRIVHFSTHGILNDDHPELSGLVLSLVNERGSAIDGFLRLHEVYNLILPAELVVLSACESGLGRQVAGEGLLGLARAFTYAGAKGLAVGLWRLEDESAATLMQEFYRGMLGPRHMSPAAALRAAQQKTRVEKRWAHPYYWGGFILQGEWRN
jgi:CHAT domain-containing protein